MINLAQRSEQKELLDEDQLPFDAIRQNMRELNTINRFLGGHAVTIAGLKKLLSATTYHTPISICEIGCGGGDNLLALDSWCKKNNITARFAGIDIKPACISLAQERCAHLNATWYAADYATVELPAEKPAFVFSSLFCHHFSNEQLLHMLHWMSKNAGTGFFINDLHRHPLAYYSIKWLTRLFSNSYLVKNDAPLSVARGFTRKEWQQIFQQANLQPCNIQWKWAFRHLITYCNGQ